MNFKVNLIKVNKCLGMNFYSGSVRLEDLFENYQVPIYKAGTADITAKESGYQRVPKQKRVDDIRNRVMNVIRHDEKVNTEAFVDNVNLNIRTKMVEKLLTPLIKERDDYGDVFEFDFNSCTH